MTALLTVENLRAGYGPVRVLHGISFNVDPAEVVVVLGANGAGKTTTLRALSGMIPSTGTVTFDGQPLGARRTPDGLVRRGIAHLPQGRGTFSALSVDDNLRVGAHTRSDRAGVSADIERWYETFPRLGERRSQPAANLSGGEQQMLAVARALMTRPRLLLLDEPSLGLAPLITRQLFDRLRTINAETGTAMLIVEQNANLALDVAHRAYVLEVGTIATEGLAEDLRADDSLRRAYLGY